MHKTEAATRQLWHEVTIWSAISHPHIVPFIGVSRINDMLTTISEYCDEGSLYDANTRHLRLACQSPLPHAHCGGGGAARSAEVFSIGVRPELQLLAWMEGLASALAYLHSLKPSPVMHRNIKSSNCMLAQGGSRLLLTDFTTVRILDDDMTKCVGSFRWMAPEVMRDEPYSTPADMYGFGLVCYEMLTYRIPFDGFKPIQAALLTARGERPSLPDETPVWLHALLIQAWQDDSRLRPDFATAHSLLSEVKKTALTSLGKAKRPGFTLPATALWRNLTAFRQQRKLPEDSQPTSEMRSPPSVPCTADPFAASSDSSLAPTRAASRDFSRNPSFSPTRQSPSFVHLASLGSAMEAETESPNASFKSAKSGRSAYSSEEDEVAQAILLMRGSVLGA